MTSDYSAQTTTASTVVLKPESHVGPSGIQANASETPHGEIRVDDSLICWKPLRALPAAELARVAE